MEKIELVIKIDEERYKTIKNRTYCGIYDSDIYRAIDNGVPLPKGHGRLKDVDQIDDDCEHHYSDKDGSWCYSWADIDSAPTIVEADQEEQG